MQTFNRGQLRRLLEAGRLVVTGSYHFDDMHGGERSDKEMPAAPDPGDWRQRKEGTVYLRGDHFTSRSGSAYVAGDGLVRLTVHSNLNFTFRILPK